MTPLDSLSTLAPTLAIAGWQLGLITVFFIFVCVVMILTVLIQRPQGGGLSGAFGSGAGSGQTAFGARTGDALTWATIIMFVIFITTAVALNFASRPSPAPVSPGGVVGPDPSSEPTVPTNEAPSAGDQAPTTDEQTTEDQPIEDPADPEPAEGGE